MRGLRTNKRGGTPHSRPLLPKYTRITLFGLAPTKRLSVVNMINTKPIHEVRLGSIKAAVWKNETETGARYNVTFGRLYREDGRWRTTDSFGRDDLLLLGKVADQAHSWILAQPQDYSARGSANGEAAGETRANPPGAAATTAKKIAA